jgi:trehalose 6-phosphate synthase
MLISATGQPRSGYEFIAVANRLPVDRVDSPDGAVEWRRSPGGLVSALEPIMRRVGGAWVGWSGSAGEAPDPFDTDDMHLVSVPLSAGEVEDFYEGFSNATLWPLYHDVIAAPQFHRRWWDAYVGVNDRFAALAAALAAPGAIVWVHDYQLQLVPAVLRRSWPDLRIRFFNHIPFPGYEIYAQLPWRRQIVEGLLGGRRGRLSTPSGCHELPACLPPGGEPADQGRRRLGARAGNPRDRRVYPDRGGLRRRRRA